MFKVIDRYNNHIVQVFSVRDDKSGFPQFLVFEHNSWKWVSAKRFLPQSDILNNTTRSKYK